jgi:hypothetical protein
MNEFKNAMVSDLIIPENATVSLEAFQGFLISRGWLGFHVVETAALWATAHCEAAYPNPAEPLTLGKIAERTRTLTQYLICK